MIIGTGKHTYTWHEHWARIPSTPSGRNNGRTHGIAALPHGRVIVFAQMVPGVLVYDAQGTLIDQWGDRFVGAHGLQAVQENGETFLWLVDQLSCEVCKTTLDGQLVLRLDHPPLADCPEGKYMPTWADVNPLNGEVWVADGYGGSSLYRWSARGDYLGSIVGDEQGNNPFDSPHGLAFGPEGRLYIADRANHRIAVLDGAGQTIEERTNVCHSPTSLAIQDGLLYVAELFGGVKILTTDLNPVAHLGQHPKLEPAADWPQKPKWGWPALADTDDWPEVGGTPHLRPGVFSSPHGIAVGPNRDIYVAEWITGGRIIKLSPAT